MLDYIALAVIGFIVVLSAAVIVFIGSLPGKIATRRGHPWPDAVSAASWIGLATGVLWPFAFVWAFLPFPERTQNLPPDVDPSTSDTAKLKERIAALEARIEQVQSGAKAISS